MKYFLIGLLIIVCLAAASISYGGTFPITLAWEGSDASTIDYKMFRRSEEGEYDYDNPVWLGHETTCEVEIPWDSVSYFVVRAFDLDTGEQSLDSNEVKYTPVDSDGDGLVDGAEISYGTDINNPDTDGDGYSDGYEVANGGDPVDSEYGPAVVIYEDAEDLSTDRWKIGHKKATVENVFDGDLNSNVIALNWRRFKHPFTLLSNGDAAWHNDQLFVLSWKILFTRRFVVKVEVFTASGKRRVMIYKIGKPRIRGKKRDVKVYLGKKLKRNVWHTFTRDLQADLSAVQPKEVITEVNGFLVKTQRLCMIDDVKLLRTTLE